MKNLKSTLRGILLFTMGFVAFFCVFCEDTPGGSLGALLLAKAIGLALVAIIFKMTGEPQKSKEQWQQTQDGSR